MAKRGCFGIRVESQRRVTSLTSLRWCDDLEGVDTSVSSLNGDEKVFGSCRMKYSVKKGKRGSREREFTCGECEGKTSEGRKPMGGTSLKMAGRY